MRSGVSRGEIKSSLSLVQTFVDRLRSVATEPELRSMMDAICNEMGFRYFALIDHDDLRTRKAGQINIHSYPPIWADHFIEQQLYRRDPVVHACHRTSAGFAWSDLPRLMCLTADHRDILERAGREGLAQGITVPAALIGERSGSCSFAGPRRGVLMKHHLLLGQLIGAFSFEAARRIASRARPLTGAPRLSPRQRQCAVLAGKGMKSLAIAHELGLTPKTVANYLDGARRRYRVHSCEQLLIQAVLNGDINLIELDARQ